MGTEFLVRTGQPIGVLRDVSVTRTRPRDARLLTALPDSVTLRGPSAGDGQEHRAA
jgi:hypothetical protein